jgi:REP element-mobilizing transposase RayT
MGRRPRADGAGAWHHVYNRGADRQDIFSSDRDRDRFEHLLAEAAADVGAEIHAYCQMTNHFHALVHCPAGGVSTALHRLQSRYATWYNDRYDRTGPVFGGRFGSTMVTSQGQLLETSRYIHTNPLAIVPIGALRTYRWSSFGCYVGARRQPEWLHTDVVLAAFSGDRARYRDFVEAGATESEADGVSAPSLDAVIEAVCTAAGVARTTLRSDARGVRNDPRTMVALLATELRSAGTGQVADELGTASTNTVRTLARRGRVLRVSDESFRRFEERVREALWTR